MKTECKFHQAPRIPDFDKVHHIPDPIPDGEHYKPFSELYGTETTERYRPSLTTRANPDKGIPFVVSKQTALNVGQVIQCDECGKWRLVHANAKLPKTEIDLLCNVLSEISYSCGTSLQDGEDTETGVLQSVYVRKDNLSVQHRDSVLQRKIRRHLYLLWNYRELRDCRE